MVPWHLPLPQADVRLSKVQMQMQAVMAQSWRARQPETKTHLLLGI